MIEDSTPAETLHKYHLSRLCISWNRKHGFILLPSQKIIVKNSLSYWEPCNQQWGPNGRCETWLGPVHVICWPSISSYLICRESYIYWVQRNNSSVYSVAVTQSCYTLVLTNIIFIISNFISLLLLILRTSRLNLFLGYHYATFPIRSLGFLEFYPNPPLSIFCQLSRGSASHLAIMRTIWPEWTRALWPPLS